MDDAISADELIDIAEMNGIRLDAVRRVHDRLFVANERRGSDESRVYVKLYAEHKSSNLLRIVDIQDQIGLPNCKCMTRGSTALVLDKAKGWPLSYVLPVTFFPGIWWLKKERLVHAFTRLGTFLGRLHTLTGDGSRRAIDEAETDYFGRRTNLPWNAVSNETREDFCELLNLLRDENSHQCIIHTDPSPHNVFYRSGDVELIDINCSTGSSIRDNAHVVLGIELMVARLPYARSDFAETLETAYWTGYNQNREHDMRLIDRYKIVAIARLLTYYCENPLPFVVKVTKITDVPILKNMLRSSLDSILID